MKKPTTKLNKCANDRKAGDKTRSKFPKKAGSSRTDYVAKPCPPKKANVVRGSRSA